MTESSTEQIRPFTIAIGDDVVDDLHRRLENVRWPDAEVVDDWSQGMPLAYAQELVEYWIHSYDWRSREALLNRFDQFMITLDAADASADSEVMSDRAHEPIDVHFIHQRSSHPDATPLLITHGWPGSIVEFQRIIEPLTEPTRFGGEAADAFHVVAPSLPGFGFSGVPRHPGCGAERIAAMWKQLMHRLGYDRYVAQGGDWGSAVTSLVGAIDPEHCAGIHVTLAMNATPPGPPTEPDELEAIERLKYYLAWDSGYSTQQKSRPQTLGYGLADSPTGQMAWIVEKFWSWAHHDGDPAVVLGRDAMLDNVMLYWCTNTATSSARLYWESFSKVARLKVEVPTGVAVYAKEIIPPVRSWMTALFPNIVHWQAFERGGHFAAWEVPDTFVADLRAWRTTVLGMHAEPALPPDDVTFHVVDPTSDEAIEAMQAYFAELDARFVGGFDPGDSLTVGAHAMREPNGGTFVVAHVGNMLAACGGVQRHDERTGEIKRMWVNPDCRGIGLGRRMLAELEAHVTRLGYTQMVLDTNDVLTEAISLYTRSGYREIDAYNDNPFARHWFSKSTTVEQEAGPAGTPRPV